MIGRYLLLIYLFISCQGPAEITLPDKIAPHPLKVSAVTVIDKPMSYEIYAEGIVQAEEKQELYFQRAGTIRSMTTGGGQKIRKGDTLAFLENESEVIALEIGRIRKEQARYTYESELIGFNESGDLTDTIRKSIRYSSGLAIAEKEYSQRRLEWKSTFLIAQYNGILANVSARPGEMARASEPIGYIYNPSTLTFRADLLELLAFRISRGMKAKVIGMEGQEVNATVNRIDPHVDPDGFVKIWLVPDSCPWFPGSHVTIIFQEKQHQGIAIPARAILSREEKLMVYKIEGQRVIWQYIQTGLQTGNMVEVTEGLNAGDTIAVDHLAELSHGLKVIPIF